MPNPHPHALERLIALRDLEQAGYGSRMTLTRLIKRGDLPAVRTPGGFKVRESDLSLIAVPVIPVRPGVELR